MQAQAKENFPPFTLSIHHLSKHFGTLEIFNRRNFSFSSEKPWCIMAASGFGKTTLFRILLGLEKAEEGEIDILDASCDKDRISANPLKELRISANPLKEPRISAVFQENRLCETLSPVDNLLLAVPELNRQTAEQELSRLLPAECLNRPVSTLSGGMKRRAALVRAVCFSGTILLMDEPFTGLDEYTKQEAARYILSRRQGRLFIFSSHQEEEGRLLGAEILHL
ncbi:MAG: ATP-binding cassette domain-containing protein [Lachnospiraceae bacterium]|nr:ATP-binding cassette domain-containing protein [Lachnospiraceae bacterium]